MQKPSLRTCIDEFCLRCRNEDVWEVANCNQPECPLHSVRPNQSLCGKQKIDYLNEEVKQEVLDALTIKGLKEFKYV